MRKSDISYAKVIRKVIGKGVRILVVYRGWCVRGATIALPPKNKRGRGQKERKSGMVSK